MPPAVEEIFKVGHSAMQGELADRREAAKQFLIALRSLENVGEYYDAKIRILGERIATEAAYTNDVALIRTAMAIIHYVTPKDHGAYERHVARLLRTKNADVVKLGVSLAYGITKYHHDLMDALDLIEERDEAEEMKNAVNRLRSMLSYLKTLTDDGLSDVEAESRKRAIRTQIESPNVRDRYAAAIALLLVYPRDINTHNILLDMFQSQPPGSITGTEVARSLVALEFRSFREQVALVLFTLPVLPENLLRAVRNSIARGEIRDPRPISCARVRLQVSVQPDVLP